MPDLTNPLSQEGLERIAAGLTRGGREMLTGRHTEAGNPWPFIGMQQRGGGAKSRMFDKMKAAGLYDRGNDLTPLGLLVRAHLLKGNEHGS